MDAARIRYPLPCGCAGPKYISMCEEHQGEQRAAHRAHFGVSAAPHCPTCGCAQAVTQ